MNVTFQRVKFNRFWLTLPNLAVVEDYPTPNRPILIEPFADEYSEQELRNWILVTADAFGYGVLSSAAIAALPDNYVRSLYANTRYRSTIMDGIFPIRAETNFSTSVHAIPNLVLMSRLFLYLYRIKAVSIEPDKKAEADRLLRILRSIDYVLWYLLKDNPTAAGNNKLVFSGQVVTTTAAQGETVISEDTYVVYMDEDLLQEYEAAGGTAQEAAQWWYDHKTQPPMPD